MAPDELLNFGPTQTSTLLLKNRARKLSATEVRSELVVLHEEMKRLLFSDTAWS